MRSRSWFSVASHSQGDPVVPVVTEELLVALAVVLAVVAVAVVDAAAELEPEVETELVVELTVDAVAALELELAELAATAVDPLELPVVEAVEVFAAAVLATELLA